jgi:hypothetical protein
MPFYIQAYILIFAFILCVNAGLWFKTKGKALLFAYEMISGISMMIIIAAYWVNEIKEYIGPATVISYSAIVAFDFYFSVLASPKDLSSLLPEAMTADIEYGKAFSILFAAPAYIIGFMLFKDIFS